VLTPFLYIIATFQLIDNATRKVVKANLIYDRPLLFSPLKEYVAVSLYFFLA